MTEEKLKEYWAAYDTAFKIIKNHQNVSLEVISQEIKKHGTIFNRLFCLTVWQEIKRIRLGGHPLDMKVYQKAFYDAWRLFKSHSDPDISEDYWDDLVSEIGILLKKLGITEFAQNLLVNTTLEELDLIYTKSHDPENL